jgi:AraC family transcriptional regulator of adaptative response/methylated-DNA-[protein]-cysteine methyltransferase
MSALSQLETLDPAAALDAADLHAAGDYALVAEAIRYLEENFRDQPSLETVAGALHLSPFHLQRLFTRWAGISPKRFLQFLTLDYAKAQLAASAGVLESAYAAGLSGPSRLHDLFVTLEAVTPGEYKQQGAGMEIHVGRHATPFGDCLLAATARGIVALNFIDEPSDESSDEPGTASSATGAQGDPWAEALAALHRQWAAATFVEDADFTAPLATLIFAEHVESRGPTLSPLRLLVKGTNFQVKVWEALLQIPSGALATYGDVARVIQHPNAVRAVGGAVGANAIAYLIPCHRVIRQGGYVRDYRWGSTRKRAMLGWEAARKTLDKAPPSA